MAQDGWSNALMAASGVAVAGAQRDDELWALVMEARAADLRRERLVELAQHRETEVREAIASRADCPLGMQATLCHDRKASVRIALAAGPGLAGSIARILATGREAAVLKALARNDVTPRDVLTQLSRHRREEVAHLATRALTGAPAPRLEPPASDFAARQALEWRAVGERGAGESGTVSSSPVGQRTAPTYAPRPQVPMPGARLAPTAGPRGLPGQTWA